MPRCCCDLSPPSRRSIAPALVGLVGASAVAALVALATSAGGECSLATSILDDKRLLMLFDTNTLRPVAVPRTVEDARKP